jgi:hypothetical protein
VAGDLHPHAEAIAALVAGVALLHGRNAGQGRAWIGDWCLVKLRPETD